ncbi:MAG: inner membrane protein YpjD [Vicinamibacterales bacterium]
MENLVRLLNTLLPLGYGGALSAYSMAFFGGQPLASRLARRAMEATLAAHVLFLVALTAVERHIPLSSGPEIMTVLALAVAIVYVAVERRTGVERTGMFLTLLPLTLQIVSSSFLEFQTVFPAILESPLFVLHTIAAVVGYAGFCVSAVYSGLYLVLHRSLKHGRFGLVFDRLPPLEVLARMSVGAARAGVSSLMVTIVVGSAWAFSAAPGFVRDPKFLLTVAVWGGYLIAIMLHRRSWWSDRRTVAGFLVGFVLLVGAALASRLIFDSFHTFA